MNNPQILEIIENLKGRKAYEEKRAAKLGFSSLYAYIAVSYTHLTLPTIYSV